VEGLVSDKPSQDGHRRPQVQPLEPIPFGMSRTGDGTDRQNLADTAIAGFGHEPRARVPSTQDTSIEAPPIRPLPPVRPVSGDLSDRSAHPATDAPERGLPLWVLVFGGALAASTVLGVLFFLAFA
jgi:hypothetical protein